MCLSTVYNEKRDPKNEIMANVQRIELDEDKVILTDLMDRQTIINGKLLYVDLVGAVAVVQKA